MGQSPITTPAAVCLAADGTTEWAKDGDNLTREIASVTKAFALYHLATAGLLPPLDQDITYYHQGGTPGDATTLGHGDIASTEDFIHAILLYSDNRATDAVTLTSMGYSPTSISHLPEWGPLAETFYASGFGWSGMSFDVPSGLGDTLVSARMVAELGHAIRTDHPWLLTIMGTTQWSATVGGPNARTVTMGYLAAPVKAAVEAGGGTWLGSKGGTASGPTTYSQVILWADPDGGSHSIGLIGAPSTLARDNDITTIVSDVIANLDPDPDPDPPTESGLYRTDGTSVALMRTDGSAAIVH